MTGWNDWTCVVVWRSYSDHWITNRIRFINKFKKKKKKNLKIVAKINCISIYLFEVYSNSIQLFELVFYLAIKSGSH